MLVFLRRNPLDLALWLLFAASLFIMLKSSSDPRPGFIKSTALEGIFKPLVHGADPSLILELDDLTPLQAARKHGHEEFVALFLRLGVKDPRRPFWWRWLSV